MTEHPSRDKVPRIVAAIGALGLCAVPWMPMIRYSGFTGRFTNVRGPAMLAVVAGVLILIALARRRYTIAAFLSVAALCSALLTWWQVWSQFSNPVVSVIEWGAWAHPIVAALAGGASLWARVRTT